MFFGRECAEGTLLEDCLKDLCQHLVERKVSEFIKCFRLAFLLGSEVVQRAGYHEKICYV